jgi:hypothetical protein
MVWIVELITVTLIVVCVAIKFYNIGYNECTDDFNEKYDFKDTVKPKEGEKNEN